jgi:hypothetical protein
LKVVPLVGTIRIQPEGHVNIGRLVDLDLEAWPDRSDDFVGSI